MLLAANRQRRSWQIARNQRPESIKLLIFTSANACILRDWRGQPNALVILGRSRSEATCGDPGIHAVTVETAAAAQTSNREKSFGSVENLSRSALRNLLVLLDSERLDACRQRLDGRLYGGRRCGHGRRRHRRADSAGGEGCQGKEDGEQFHGAGVRR